jgi:hypothetical protein
MRFSDIPDGQRRLNRNLHRCSTSSDGDGRGYSRGFAGLTALGSLVVQLALVGQRDSPAASVSLFVEPYARGNQPFGRCGNLIVALEVSHVFFLRFVVLKAARKLLRAQHYPVTAMPFRKETMFSP